MGIVFLGQMGSSDMIVMRSVGGGVGSPMRGGKMGQNGHSGIGQKTG